MTSPISTHFYQLHGLITNWWNHWASLQKGLGKEIIDNKHLHKELIKDKDIIDHKGLKELIKEIKEKDIFEGVSPVNPVDPMVQNLTQRVAILEQTVGQAFIRPEERPDVGSAATGAKKPKSA